MLAPICSSPSRSNDIGFPEVFSVRAVWVYVCTACSFFGGDWFRQGTFEVGSKPWSPRHVKQGSCQIELTTITLLSLNWLSLLN